MLKNSIKLKQIVCFSLIFIINIFLINLILLPTSAMHDNIDFVSAQNEDNNQDVTIIDTGEKLYEELLIIRDGQRPEDIESVDPLKRNTFSSIENLDLSNRNIVNTFGLGFFDFSNLKTLNLSHNNIVKVDAQTFKNMQSLETIDLSHNKIENIEFPQTLKVQSLKFEFNKISNINLQNIDNINELEGFINLAHNELTSIKNLILPKINSPKYIELFGNKINDIQALTNYAPHKLNLICQSLYNNIEIDDKTTIKIFPSFNKNNYFLRATNLQTNQTSDLIFNKNNCLRKGKYKIEIYNNEINLSNNPNNVFKSFEINVLKSAPTVQAYINNKLITPNEKITEPVTLKFNSGDELYIVYYSINGGNFEYGNSLTLDKNGHYNIVVKSVNGLNDTSQLLTIGVNVEISQFSFWIILVMIVCITLISLIVLLLLRWINSK